MDPMILCHFSGQFLPSKQFRPLNAPSKSDFRKLLRLNEERNGRVMVGSKKWGFCVNYCAFGIE